MINIGIFEPLSGEYSEGGNLEYLGIEYANSVCPEITVKNKTFRINLVVKDNESSSQKARFYAGELLDKKVSVVLGTFGSSIAVPASAVFRDRKVPCVGMTCTDPEITKNNDYYFRICYQNPFQGEVLADFAFDTLKARNAYILADSSDDYTISLSKQFITSFKSKGGQCYIDTFETENRDFTGNIRRAENLNADVLLALSSIRCSEKILFACKYGNLKIPVLSGDGWDSGQVSGYARMTDNDVYISTFYAEGSSSTESKKFSEGFKGYLNENPEKLLLNKSAADISAATAMGYDAYFVVLEAIRQAQSGDPEKIKRALSTINIEGVTGPVEFRNEQDAIRNVAYIKHAGKKDSKWKFVSVEKLK